MATKKLTPSKQAAKNSSPAKMTMSKSQNSETFILLSKLRFDGEQPRTDYRSFDGRLSKESEAYIVELSASIKAQELIEAIVVRPDPDNKGCHIVVVGESRTRAHLHLGLKKIRAVIREDLADPAKRLLFQLAENINRKPLSDYDMARAVVRLRYGDETIGLEGINQSEIAEKLGKSEGWVSRCLKYADEDNQRIWIKSGIADTVEKLYRITLLNKQLQLEILRRVDLPENDPERFDKPLNRSLIDDLYSKSKQLKTSATAEKPGAKVSQSGSANAKTGQEASYGNAGMTGGYSLPDAERQKLLQTDYSSQYPSKEKGQKIPAINCRGTLKNTLSLLESLSHDQVLNNSMLDLVVDMIIPGELAKSLAAKLSGAFVEDKDVPMAIQNKLSSFK